LICITMHNEAQLIHAKLATNSRPAGENA
jgi:hypothetical protein